MLNMSNAVCGMFLIATISITVITTYVAIILYEEYTVIAC